MKKILIIRFSSIGDIVLTTPVMRVIKESHPEVIIHFVTKSAFAGIVKNNPNVDRVFEFKDHIDEVLLNLKSEQYDFIIDLHHNIRSGLIKIKLGKPSSSFNKLNIEKWLMVNFKVNRLPDTHIVNRYIASAPFTELKYDGKGLDFFIPSGDEVDLSKLPKPFNSGYYIFVIGAKHATKRLPVEKITEIINRLDLPVVLAGGKEDVSNGEKLQKNCGDRVYNSCGKYNLNQSASLVKQARFVITHDTGLMHIAAAFHQRIISVWGNTIPGFGMYPLLPEGEGESIIIENNELKCRPCSKIGFDRCPKQHFKCMNDIDIYKIVNAGKLWW